MLSSSKNSKIIVIAGGGQNVGKTHLANCLGAILPNAQVVKLGHHQTKKEHKNPNLLPLKATFAEVISLVGNPDFLVIESGSILDDPNLDPALVIFLPAITGPDKPGSEKRRKKAHLIRGEEVDPTLVNEIKERLSIDNDTWNQIFSAINLTQNTI